MRFPSALPAALLLAAGAVLAADPPARPSARLLAASPPPLAAHLATWEKVAARLLHGLFYVLLIGLPLLGWIGTWVTGSATSANALFAQMQATTAGQVGVSPTLLVGANTAGATLGKMMSPQTLTIAATAVNMENGEAKIMGQAWKYSLGLLVYVCVLVFLQSSVFGFMVVG